MTAAILSILAALVPFCIWLWRRRAARQDAPEARRNEIDTAIAAADAKKVNELLDDEVRSIPPTSGPHRD